MLYVSTRNSVDTFTAYRALQGTVAPCGGFYAPFYLNKITDDELLMLKTQPFSATVAQFLNLFFGLQLNAIDVEFAVGKTPVRTEYLNYNLIMSEAWHNPEGTFDYLLRKLYRLASGKDSADMPTGWVRVAIEISVLFAIYGTLDEEKSQGIDIAVSTEDFADIAATLYAIDMGLPVNRVVCACSENSGLWELVNRGEYCASAQTPDPSYLEYLLARAFGTGEAARFADTRMRKKTFSLDDEQPQALSAVLFAAVVGANRVDTIINSMYTTNQYQIDPMTAIAFGGLQDYRAQTGISSHTLILAKQRPKKVKE